MSTAVNGGSTAAPAGVVVPRATYRLQFSPSLRFQDATALVPYLAALGVSHLYASPILKPRPGSTHGYDVIDPGQLNPELGTEADFETLCDTLAGHGMKLLLDIVPNHMGVLEADNLWWLDVLENGPSARHAAAFDIEWQPPQPELHGKLLLAVLGQPYGLALEAGELRPVFEPARGQFVIHCFEHRFPIDPADHAALLRLVPLPIEADAKQAARIDALCEGFARLPPRDCNDPAARAARQREGAALKQTLAQWQADTPWSGAWLDACAHALQGRSGEPASFDALHALLQRQAWRLAHWRAGSDELNYRRFFDIDALAGLRVEDEGVFEDLHQRVLGWVADGRVAGLRIDHPDGMADPAAYFRRLQQRCAQVRAPVYLVVEKILADDEAWPQDWPAHGDTGYRFANQALGVFVDGANAGAFDALYADFAGTPIDFDAELDAAKRSMMSTGLSADLQLLTELAHRLSRSDRRTRDLTRQALQAAIVEYAAAMDVYRTYVADGVALELDRACIEKCTALARTRLRPALFAALDFVRDALLVDAATLPPAQRGARLRFVQRLQQFTAPVMAKSMEDTAFYRFHRLVALNDVGGDPRHFGLSLDAFHAANALRQREMPHTLAGGSTHDSKRSEDVRARLAVLSEMPQRWAEALQRWRELASAQLRVGNGSEPLHPNDEMLLYQTLAGICPFGPIDDEALAELRRRVGAYMLKALREAKQRSSWTDGNAAYEARLESCIDTLLARVEPNPFLGELRRFVADIAPFGCCNSLGMLALKCTSPGVPDIYQGNEDWAFALVDPDNRRPVDFGALRARLDALATASNHEMAALHEPRQLPSGPHKLWLARQLLRWRTAAAALFEHADYRPLAAEGNAARHVIAFARCSGSGGCSISVVGRHLYTLTAGRIERLAGGACWADAGLVLPQELAAQAPSAWVDVLSGRRIVAARRRTGGAAVLALRDVLSGLPVAVLRPEPGGPQL